MKNFEEPDSMKNPEMYTKYYSESGLMVKLGKFAKKAGTKLVYSALVLYYVLKSKSITAKDKTLIIGALGYLILPLDLIPDVIPALGLTDDLAALMFALSIVKKYVDDDIEQQAKDKLSDWFDDYDESELNIL